MDLNKTQEELQKELAISHPSFPPSAIECISYSTSSYYSAEKERRRLQIECDMWKEKFYSKVDLG